MIKFAFLLTIVAGLSTTIGGLISFMIKKYNLKVLAVGLGFSAGAMIYISLVELLKESVELLAKDFSSNYAGLISTLAFVAGIFMVALIDYFIPAHFDEQLIKENKPSVFKSFRQKKLYRIGLITFLVIFIHNIPEGLATFSAALVNRTLGISIALAIAIHNIPEGIAVSLPIYYATGSKWKALLWSFWAGIAEPIGALLGFKFINLIFSNSAFGILLACTAGFMIYISFDELIPTAKEYGKDHLSLIGIISGMIVMAVSLNILA
jgi:zinc transporter, ZIP family